MPFMCMVRNKEVCEVKYPPSAPGGAAIGRSMVFFVNFVHTRGGRKTRSMRANVHSVFYKTESNHGAPDQQLAFVSTQAY